MLMILTSFRIALRYCQPGCLSVVSPLGLVNFAKKKKKTTTKKKTCLNCLFLIIVVPIRPILWARQFTGGHGGKKCGNQKAPSREM